MHQNTTETKALLLDYITTLLKRFDDLCVPKYKADSFTFLSLMALSILGDPGADRGGKGKSKRAKENGDEEKHSTARRVPGDKFLPDQFQTAEVILNSDWCQKFFVFSAQSEVSRP